MMGTEFAGHTKDHRKYFDAVNELILCLGDVLGKDETTDIIHRLPSDVTLEHGRIVAYSQSDMTLWMDLFDVIFRRNGASGISAVEAEARMIARKWNVALPPVFEYAQKRGAFEIFTLREEIEQLNNQKRALEEKISDMEQQLLRCPVTGLLNERYFHRMIRHEAVHGQSDDQMERPSALILLSVDGLGKIRHQHGDHEVDEVLKSLAYLIREETGNAGTVFRLLGAAFAISLREPGRAEAIRKAEQIRMRVAAFEGFIERMTVTGSVADLSEILTEGTRLLYPAQMLYDLGNARLAVARRRGPNLIYSEDVTDIQKNSQGRVLLVDTDEVCLSYLRNSLGKYHIEVFTAKDGYEAMNIAERERPDVIVSEAMLPRMDGFVLRQNLMNQSATCNIRFMMYSHLKNDASVHRALHLGITHYLKKPCLSGELTGIVRNLLSQVTIT